MIVDDSATVWPGHGANLVQVERYCYFPNATKQFGYTRYSLLEAGRCGFHVTEKCSSPTARPVVGKSALAVIQPLIQSIRST